MCCCWLHLQCRVHVNSNTRHMRQRHKAKHSSGCHVNRSFFTCARVVAATPATPRRRGTGAACRQGATACCSGAEELLGQACVAALRLARRVVVCGHATADRSCANADIGGVAPATVVGGVSNTRIAAGLLVTERGGATQGLRVSTGSANAQALHYTTGMYQHWWVSAFQYCPVQAPLCDAVASPR